MDCLLDSGANPTLKNSKGYSAVHYAAALGNKQHLELVSYIIAKRFYLLLNLIYFILFFFLGPFQLLEISFNCLEEAESNVPVSPLHLAVSEHALNCKHAVRHSQKC